MMEGASARATPSNVLNNSALHTALQNFDFEYSIALQWKLSIVSSGWSGQWKRNCTVVHCVKQWVVTRHISVQSVRCSFWTVQRIALLMCNALHCEHIYCTGKSKSWSWPRVQSDKLSAAGRHSKPELLRCIWACLLCAIVPIYHLFALSTFEVDALCQCVPSRLLFSVSFAAFSAHALCTSDYACYRHLILTDCHISQPSK